MSMTVAIIGNTNHKLMEFALEKTIQSVPYDEILVFSDRELILSKEYKFVKIKNPFGLHDYMVLASYEMNSHIDTDHVLLIQYDGFAAQKDNWRSEFLEYDYVGPLINPFHPPVLHRLIHFKNLAKDDLRKQFEKILEEKKWIGGGGGFSLRSKKYLQKISENDGKNFPIGLFFGDNQKYFWSCDDVILHYFEEEKIKKAELKIAPVGTSLNFAAEIATSFNFSLGFHGWQNSPLFLSENELIFFMENFKSKDKLMLLQDQGIFLGHLWFKGYFKIFEKYKVFFNEINMLVQKENKLVKVWP